MKKLLILLLVLVLCIPCFAACASLQGPQGEPGIQGEKGEKGDTGVGIASVKIVDGEAIVTYTDGNIVNAGTVFSSDIPNDDEPNKGSEGLAYYPLPDGTYAVGAGTTTRLEEIVIPETYKGKPVTTMVRCAFDGSSNLKSITIPGTVTTIENSVFWECINLTSIVIPEGVTSIGVTAFGMCENLISVTLPESLTHIGERAFFACDNLTSINYSGTVDQWNAIDKEDNWDVKITIIYCTDGTVTE